MSIFLQLMHKMAITALQGKAEIKFIDITNKIPNGLIYGMIVRLEK